jgi:MoxR-like ATPase
MTTVPESLLTSRIRQLRDELSTGLVERDLTIRLALLATLAGEHLLLLGPPGTAKSLVARRLHLAVAESAYFERLLTRFTVPEELFGPLSIKGLEEDRYERLTTAYLPSAAIAFLDEIFKANSAILNALLTLLNEREFDNGTRRVRTPLVAVIGASNELPDGEELHALFDRFLLRLHVGSVSRERFPELLALRGNQPPVLTGSLRLTAADIAAVQGAADRIRVPEDVVALLCDLRDWCEAEKIAVSDRRWRKIVRLLQVAALTNGRDQVSVWDCWLLQHCVWDKPVDRQKVYEWYASRVGSSAAMTPTQLTRMVVTWEAVLKRDQDGRSQARDAQGQPLYKKADGSSTPDTKGRTQMKRNSSLLYLAPANSAANRDAFYYNRQLNTDRINGGKYYTTAELDSLYMEYNQKFEHWPDRATYLADPNNWAMVDADLPPLMEPTRHKSLYVEQRIREVDEIKADVARYAAKLRRHMESLDQEIRTHLWVTADFAGPASQALQQTQDEVAALLARVEKVRKGFELLPREHDEDTSAIAAATDADVVEPGRSKAGLV